MFVLALIFATLIGSASAFMAPVSSSRSASLKMSERSVALPFDKRPPALDGTLAGDAGFDPAGFSNNPPKFFGGSIKWYREAEIVHGRVAQLAVVGNLVPNWFHFPGGALGVPADAFAEVNPYKALTTVPEGTLWQIAVVIFGIELARIKRVINGDKAPGDLGLGQTGFNPFGFEYTPEQYFEKQTQEIKHGRLAMFGALGMLLQASNSGKGVLQQLGDAFTFPDATAVVSGPSELADYFPAGF